MKLLSYPSISQFAQLVELKDYRPATKKEYLRYVCKLAQHFQCDPASLSENQIREYFLFLRQHKHYKAAPMKAAKHSLLCFFVDCLKVQGWTVFKEVRIAEPQVLPVVLSRAEVQALLGAVREPRFRTVLRLMYHCGLRVGEAVGLQVSDVRGKQTPPVLHLRNGKGGKDRFVPIGAGHGRGVARLVARASEHHLAVSFTGPGLGRSDPVAQPVDEPLHRADECQFRADGLPAGAGGQRRQSRFHHAQPAAQLRHASARRRGEPAPA
jgi:site-specific recombinase XerD